MDLQTAQRIIDETVALSTSVPYTAEEIREAVRAMERVGSGLEKIKRRAKTFYITVNYRLSLVEMIATSRQRWVTSNISPSQFSVSGEGVQERTAILVHFERFSYTEDAIQELNAMNLFPATIAELLAFGAAFPDIQRKFNIAALGSTCGLNEDRRVPYLARIGDEKRIHLAWWNVGWNEHTRFLAIRE